MELLTKYRFTDNYWHIDKYMYKYVITVLLEGIDWTEVNQDTLCQEHAMVSWNKCLRSCNIIILLYLSFQHFS